MAPYDVDVVATKVTTTPNPGDGLLADVWGLLFLEFGHRTAIDARGNDDTNAS